LNDCLSSLESLLSPLNSFPLFSKAKTMTFFSKSSPPPAVPHHRHPFYSTSPQLTLVDALVMQAQAQALPHGDGFAATPLWIGGDGVSSSSDERQAVDLAAMIDALIGDNIPSSRNGNTGDGRESADRPKRNAPQNSPSEPSAQ
jgi:hypothetical protein